jgi:hypothetical protein
MLLTLIIIQTYKMENIYILIIFSYAMNFEANQMKKTNEWKNY